MELRFAAALAALALGVGPALAQPLSGARLTLGGSGGWILLNVRDNILRGGTRPTGERVPLRSAELPVHLRAVDESERMFDLERGSDHLILAGTRDTIGGAAPLNGIIAIRMLEEAHRGVIDRSGREEVISLGPSGPLYRNPMSSLDVPVSVGRRNVGAIVLYVGGAANPRTATFDGMAGGGYRFNLGRVSTELSLGLTGSASQLISLQDILSSPAALISSLPTGWHASAVFCVRIFQLPRGTISLVARAQVDGTLSGSESFMGWLGLSLSP